MQKLRWNPTRKSPLILAHRGGPDKGYPENNLATFKHTLKHVPNAILEMDVRMTKDSVIVLLHDESLERETTGSGLLNTITWEEADKLRLKDITGEVTPYHMSLFEDVLDSVCGKTILAIDAKPGIDLDRMLNALQDKNCLSSVFIILYSIEDAVKVHQIYPELMLAVGVDNMEKLEKIKEAGLPFKNIVALTPGSLQSREFYNVLHQHGMLGSMGTYGAFDENASDEAYLKLYQEGVDIITTDRPIPVYNMFKRNM
ncbi:glycerophosphodiester phosphodiesterase family protein [Pontibacter silvestris]|uniref:Glycerophosphodiester phosphodiesterase family protein n=2 Tax=Pontibacter silvestris TaxID=2305183 RepID=A0ABW4X0K5_9BACT|nr:glycerophosphodiester phosphodiesterase family protein [Pontibacter silvestris]MCC9135652.1 glycerophosphodiester phosphodiesterase family protein [Pontibacter silvestris]